VAYATPLTAATTLAPTSIRRIEFHFDEIASANSVAVDSRCLIRRRAYGAQRAPIDSDMAARREERSVRECAFGVQVNLDGGNASNMGDFLKRGYFGRHAADNLRVSLPALGHRNDFVTGVGNKHASQSHGLAGERRRGHGDDRGRAQHECCFTFKQGRSPLDDENDLYIKYAREGTSDYSLIRS
jgi:hypothetical protein